MDKSILEKAKKIENDISIINKYLGMFNPNQYIVQLQTEDMYGNRHVRIENYGFSAENSLALGVSSNNFCAHFKEYLQKCTADLTQRKTELENQLASL